MEKIVHKTWLLDGVFHSAPGFIIIENGRFKFSLVDTGPFSKKRLQKFEKYKNLNDTFTKLRNEEVVEIIDASLSDISAKFPWYNFMGGAVLNIKGQDQKMQLSFMQPQNTKFPYHKLDNSIVQFMAVKESVRDLKSGRKFGENFKKLLL